MKNYFELLNKRIEELKEEINKQTDSSSSLHLSSLIFQMEENIKEIQSQVERELRIYQIENALYNSPRSMGETMDHIANIIKAEFEFSRFDIVIMDHRQKRVFRRYSKGGFGEADLEKLCRHGALGATRDYALNHKEPWIVNDVKKEDPKWELALELDVLVHGTFPIYRKNREGEDELICFLHGARNRESFLKGKVFTSEEVEEMKRLGTAIGSSVNEANLSHFAHGVMTIQSAIGSTRIDMAKAPEDFLCEGQQNQMNTVLDAMLSSLSASMGLILIRGEEGIQVFAGRTDRKENISSDSVITSFRPLTGLTGRAILDGFSVIENEVSRHFDKLDIQIMYQQEPLYTMLSVPLIEAYSMEGRVMRKSIGAIVLFNKKDEKKRIIQTDYQGNEGGFTTLDQKILEAISPHIETIISNTRSHLDLQKMSITDGLTKLANHSHFMQNLLTLEYNRSRRYGTPLSVILTDIDHFKVFNDIYGHQVGDLVLQETARIIRENTRSVDHVARYGGEEFAIILQNTSLRDARFYAEKIRRLVQEGNYIAKIREKNLLNIDEAYHRFKAILEINDENIREAKLSIMRNHFKLDIYKVVELIEEGKIAEARDEIYRSFKVTISIGLAFYPDTRISSKKDLVTTADMLLLKAKEKGRNRVEMIEL